LQSPQGARASTAISSIVSNNRMTGEWWI
jgi:hypothetical protein